MTSNQRLRVLVMPEEFPRDADDLAGVFTRDYIASIERFCDVVVLRSDQSNRRGLARLTDEGSGVEHLIWTPWIRGHGETRQRLGRLEALYELGRLAGRLPKVDVIHAHGPVFHGAAALTLGRKLAVPVALTVHTGPFRKLLRRHSVRSLTRRTIEGVNCVCPVSDDLRRQIEAAGFRPRRIEVTYNPVNTELFRPGGLNNGGTHKRIVFAGRLEEYKGALRVVRAFGEIAERWAGWTLTIAGDGPERAAIDEYLRSRPALAARVCLLGSYTRAQLAGLLAESACFVYPSRHETFGIVIAEAMSAGLPVIGPNCTAPPEFIDDRSGLLVPPDDLRALSQAMERLLGDLPSYRRDVIRGTVVERFGLDAFGRRLLTLYSDLCQKNGDTGACVASRA